MINYKEKIIEALQEKEPEQYTTLQQIMLGGIDFWHSYQDMREQNLIGFDKYAHAKKYPNIPTHELLQKYWVKDETGQVAK